MKMSNTGEVFRLITVTADNTTTITKNAHDSAMLPVSGTVFIRQFQNTQKIIANIYRNLILNVSFILVP